MAISETHYRLLRELREKDLLPQYCAILEIGEANFYGDMENPQHLIDDAHRFLPEEMALSLQRELVAQIESRRMPESQFAIAKSIYSILMRPTRRVSIDAGGPSALKHDLNSLQVGNGDCVFNVSINHGTAEHIFNIANVFRVMHDSTVEGGLMIHESPFTGWVDHGFYCLQPTLFFDLAAVNGYEVVMLALEHLASKSIIHIESREYIHELARRDQLPNNAMLFVVLRKGADGPFKVPMQGVYAGAVSDSAQKAWRELR